MLGFQWREIRSISFKDKKLSVKPVDEKAPVSYVIIKLRLKWWQVALWTRRMQMSITVF